LVELVLNVEIVGIVELVQLVRLVRLVTLVLFVGFVGSLLSVRFVWVSLQLRPFSYSARLALSANGSTFLGDSARHHPGLYDRACIGLGALR
jgi:hypothetical protein